MVGDSFWRCLDSVAAVLESDRDASDVTMRQLEADLQALSIQQRDEMRRRMTLVAAELCRLELRMKELDGPIADPR